MTSLLDDESRNEGLVFTLTRSLLTVSSPSSSAGYSNESCVVDISDLLSDEKSPISSPFSDMDITRPIPPKPVPKPSSSHDSDLTSVFVPHMVFSCMAMWCCGCVLGCLGFGFAGNLCGSPACVLRCTGTKLWPKHAGFIISDNNYEDVAHLYSVTRKTIGVIMRRIVPKNV